MKDKKSLTKAAKIGSVFQIMFYNIHNRYQRSPLHKINAAEVYEKFKWRKLMISFNKIGLDIIKVT